MKSQVNVLVCIARMEITFDIRPEKNILVAFAVCEITNKILLSYSCYLADLYYR